MSHFSVGARRDVARSGITVLAIEPNCDEASEHETDDVLVDVGGGEDRLHELRELGDALDVRAAFGGHAPARALALDRGTPPRDALTTAKSPISAMTMNLSRAVTRNSGSRSVPPPARSTIVHRDTRTTVRRNSVRSTRRAAVGGRVATERGSERPVPRACRRIEALTATAMTIWSTPKKIHG